MKIDLDDGVALTERNKVAIRLSDANESDMQISLRRHELTQKWLRIVWMREVGNVNGKLFLLMNEGRRKRVTSFELHATELQVATQILYDMDTDQSDR